VALEGTLRDFSLSDILQLIALQRKTGLLTLKNPDDAVTLGFDEGKLISAESSAKRLDTRLGTLLVKTSCLTAELLSKALEIQGQTLQRLGFILLKNGFCTAEDLRQGLDTQIRKITFGLFRWADGDYVFDAQERVDYDREFVAPISVESLLMEGARMMDEWPIIEKVVRAPHLVFQRVPVSQPVVLAEEHEEPEEIGEASLARRAKEGRDEPIKISRQEWPIYELVDGRRTVAAIIDRTFLSDFDGFKAFYDLVSRGLIAEVKPVLVTASPLSTVTGELKRIRRKQSPFVVLNVLGGIALLTLLVAGWSAQSRNPVNLLTFPARRIPIVESFGKSLSLLRLRRLSEAVDTYYLGRGKFPETLEDVENLRLVGPSDTRDPWGRGYRYVLQRDLGKYYLIGFDSDGKTDPDLFISHRARNSSPLSDSAAVPKPSKEVLVVK
jgi:hypothetical protein